MSRTLFCEIGPAAYALSREKEILKRRLQNRFRGGSFAKTKQAQLLPVLVHRHQSLIRRSLNNVDLSLQDNKAKSLGIAAPLVSGILIRPGETFSFWELVGRCTRRKGYLEGVVISRGAPGRGVGGGMCQFTNLIHWMVLHTPLEITEHHHHNALDLFPDFDRQIPFGTGSSIVYNYLDYRFRNNSDTAYQLIVTTSDTHLCGEIRAEKAPGVKIHIREEDAYFFEKDGEIFRHNKIFRRVVDKRSGNTLLDELLLENCAKTMYDREFIPAEKMRKL